MTTIAPPPPEQPDNNSRLLRDIRLALPFLSEPDVFRTFAKVGRDFISDIHLAADRGTFEFYLASRTIAFPGTTASLEYHSTLLFGNSHTKELGFASMLWVKLIFHPEGNVKNKLVCYRHDEREEWAD